MKRIFKYPLPNCEINYVNMPGEAKILSLQIQRNVPCLWAEVEVDREGNPCGLWEIRADSKGEPEQVPVLRSFVFFGTGHEFNDENLRYIGTVQLLVRDGFVIHLYEDVSA